MPRPKGDALWATNATFVSPGDPWDGDPNKIEPSTGRKEEGWEPTQEPPSGFFNFWQNEIYNLARYLSPIQAFRWLRLNEPTGITQIAGQVIQDPSQGTGSPVVAPRYILAIFAPTVASARFSNDRGKTWITPSTEPTVTSRLTDVHSDQLGTEIMSGVNNTITVGEIWRSSDGGDNWASVAPAWGATGSARDPWFDATIGGSGTWVIAETGTPAWYRSTDGGVTWAIATTPPTGAHQDISGDRSGLIVVATADGIFSSTDGDVYTQRLTLAGAGEVRGLGYSAGTSSHYAVGEDDSGNQALWTSTDGITWIQQLDPTIQAMSNPDKIQTDEGDLILVWDTTDARFYISEDRGVTVRQGPQLASASLDFSFEVDRFMANTGDDDSIWETFPMP